VPNKREGDACHGARNEILDRRDFDGSVERRGVSSGLEPAVQEQVVRIGGGARVVKHAKEVKELDGTGEIWSQ
jgi:hypothetical protein